MSIQKIIRADNQPFAIIPNSAIRNPEITTAAFRLLAYLMSHKDGYEITYDQIERQTTLGRWAINQATENLIALGYLEVHRPKGADGRFGAKHWVIMDPDSDPTDSISSTVGNSTMDEPHMGKSTDNKENYLLKKTTLKDISSNEEDFNKFWATYPRKTSKLAARKAFDKALKTVSFEELLQGAERYANDPNRHPSFTAEASTWLNNGRWEDEPLPTRVMSFEEKRDWQSKQSKQQSDSMKRAAREVIEESQEAAKNAAPPPKCQHGKNLALCITCLKKLG